ncbi:MAG: hypothetical protein ACLUN5_14030 [Oscillospiraceae bacterium]
MRTNAGAEQWRDIFNAQKFYLLVDPAYYKSALLIFDRIKKEFGSASFGLVDIGKLRERETIRPRDDSLAQKGGYGKSAGAQLCGLLCWDASYAATESEQLRNFKTAITADGRDLSGLCGPFDSA